MSANIIPNSSIKDAKPGQPQNLMAFPVPARYYGHVDIRDLKGLSPEFAGKVAEMCQVFHTTKSHAGAVVKLVPFVTLRGPETQAKLWCVSRTQAEIQRTVKYLESWRRPFAASLIAKYSHLAATGPWKTNALPGESWHQYGLAVDCYIDINGTDIWSGPLYDEYAKVAESLGLTSGKSFGDAVHVQMTPLSSPKKIAGMTDEILDNWIRNTFMYA